MLWFSILQTTKQNVPNAVNTASLKEVGDIACLAGKKIMGSIREKTETCMCRSNFLEFLTRMVVSL